MELKKNYWKKRKGFLKGGIRKIFLLYIRIIKQEIIFGKEMDTTKEKILIIKIKE